jgi:hypothetical protein
MGPAAGFGDWQQIQSRVNAGRVCINNWKLGRILFLYLFKCLHVRGMCVHSRVLLGSGDWYFMNQSQSPVCVVQGTKRKRYHPEAGKKRKGKKPGKRQRLVMKAHPS